MLLSKKEISHGKNPQTAERTVVAAVVQDQG